jgi:A/G-specific adenine glycosylase
VDAFDSHRLQTLRRRLRTWYAKHARDLPWRKTGDAYAIWISEIMLQQTTVAAVVPFFERFMSRFPTITKLAAAEEDEVLRYWEGLGYYSRARNIHKTARVVTTALGGRLPADVSSLRTLPGIGRYTAGAIVSFAFDKPAPIVEANTLRLYCRLLGYDGDPRSSAGQKVLWDFAERILPRSEPGRFNQAVMELGSQACTPKEPVCEQCPLMSVCVAFANGTQAELPLPKKRPTLTDVTEATVAVHKNGRYLLYRRGENERWAGLWDFPRYELNGESGSALVANLESKIQESTGISSVLGTQLVEFRHGVTRYRIRLLCYSAEYCEGRLKRGGGLKWVCSGEFCAYPLSVTGRKFARHLENMGR